MNYIFFVLSKYSNPENSQNILYLKLHQILNLKIIKF